MVVLAVVAPPKSEKIEKKIKNSKKIENSTKNRKFQKK